MNTYKWTCKACETPNVLVHNPLSQAQVALNCLKCGHPGVFEPLRMAVVQSFEVSQALSTSEVPDEIDYRSPVRIAKMPIIGASDV